MRRRRFTALLGAAAVWPLAACEQRRRAKRIGVLMGLAETDLEGQARISAFRRALGELGWTDGRNVLIDYRWAGGDIGRTRDYAAELVASAPDVILVNTPPGLAALQERTRTIPIVFVQVVNAVESIASLARPGGNITGFANVEYTMTGKWLEMLKEIAPRVVRVALVQNPQHPSWPGHVRTIAAAAPSFGVEVIQAPVRDAATIRRVIDAFARRANGGLLVLPDTFNTVHRELIVEMAARHRLPAVYPSRFFATDGGLMSYGADLVDLLRRAASYVDRILKGAKAIDLPVQESTKFELVINLKTARTLGLEVPPTLIARADDLIK